MRLDSLPSPIQEARPPACTHTFLDHWAWVLPVGLSLAFGLYSLTFGSSHVNSATGWGFIVATYCIYRIYRWTAECPQHKNRRSQS